MPDYSHEYKYKAPVAGVDEAGYGPWAGPVVAAAVILDVKTLPPSLLEALNDSKQLSKPKRESLFSALTQLNEEACWIAVGQASPEEIDQVNVRQANLNAMSRAVGALSMQPNTVLVDGINLPSLSMPCHRLIKGDAQSLSIAAASIIAKVTRDRIMTQLSLEYPYYGWEKNAGYGTKAHQEGLKKYGVSPHHRKTYKPIQNLLRGSVA